MKINYGPYVYLPNDDIHKEGFWLGKKEIKFLITHPREVNVLKVDPVTKDKYFEKEYSKDEYKDIKPFLFKVTLSNKNQKEFLVLVFDNSISGASRFLAKHYHVSKLEYLEINIFAYDESRDEE